MKLYTGLFVIILMSTACSNGLNNNEFTEYSKTIENQIDYIGTAWYNSEESSTIYFQDAKVVVYRTFQGDIYSTSKSIYRCQGNYTNNLIRISISKIEYFKNVDLNYWESNSYAKFLYNEKKDKRWRIITKPEIIALTK